MMIAGAYGWWGSIAALTGVAIVFIALRILNRIHARTVGLVLELVASLVGVVGLLGSLWQLKSGAGVTTAALAPALAGLGVFLFCQGVLGVFRFRSAPSRATDASVPRTEPPLSLALGFRFSLVPSDHPREVPVLNIRPARPAFRRIAPVRGDRSKRATVFAACLLGSILLHGAVLFGALRVRTESAPARREENNGVFLASIAAVLPSEHVPEKVSPPPPPKPPPVPIEPEPLPPPKEEPAEAERPTEQPAPAPVPDRTKPESAPPPPPAPAEVTEQPSEPAARPAEGKESERAKAPPARFTESAAPAKEPPAPPASAPPTPARPAPIDSPPASKASVEEPVLGFGDPGKKAESPPETPLSGPAAGVSTMKEYRQFLAREMKGGASEGRYVPNLRFADNKEQENREIMRYFGMELIAYPKNQKFYVYIDPDQGLYSRSNDFSYIHNFSSRTIFRTSSYFDGLRAEAARRVGVSGDTLVMAQLLKPSSAAYIGWKEAECAKRAGVLLEDVESCDAKFVKTTFGIWIVRIDRLLMKDGRKIEIEDFEWAKVSSPGGGER